MLATMLLFFGMASVGGVLLFNDEQTVDTEDDDSLSPEPEDGTNDFMSLVESTNAIEEETENAGSSENVVFHFDDRSLETAPEPLDDWTQAENIPIISEDETAFLDFSEDLNGSLFSIDADYSETIQSGNNSPIKTYVGQNLYFIPEGETFPPEYKWSTEGNSLYNSETHVDDASAFSGIKLVARLDGGVYLNAPDGTLLLDQTYQLPALLSNLRFS